MMKIVQALDGYGILFNAITKTIKNKTKVEKGVILERNAIEYFRH